MLLKTIVLFTLSGFNVQQEKNSDSSIYDTKWVLKKIYVENELKEVNTTSIFIRFNKENNSAGGKGGCNSYGSSVTIEGDEIKFKSIFSTKMYCEQIQETENLYLGLLGQATNYALRDNELQIFVNEKTFLVFEKEGE